MLRPTIRPPARSRVLALLILPLLIVFTMYAGDALLAARPPAVDPLLWAFLDLPVHGSLALLIALPLILLLPPSSRLGAVAAAVLPAVLIDIDHVVAAGSFSLDAALSLPLRPPSHSLTLALAVFCLVLILSRRLTPAYLLLAALASHVLRDAAGGATPLLWPLPVYGLGWPAAVAGLLLLYLGSWAVVWLRQGEERRLPKPPGVQA